MGAYNHTNAERERVQIPDNYCLFAFQEKGVSACSSSMLLVAAGTAKGALSDGTGCTLYRAPVPGAQCILMLLTLRKSSSGLAPCLTQAPLSLSWPPPLVPNHLV